MEKQEDPTKTDPVPEDDDSESLEAQTTVVEGESTSADGTMDATGGSKPEDREKKKKKPKKKFLDRVNIYLLAFIFMLVVAGVVTGLSLVKSKQVNKETEAQIKTEPLSQEALDALRQSDVKVGDPKQILSVESNAIFAGKVLIRDSLEVAGEIKAGAPISLPGLTVSGATTLGQLTTKDLQVAGGANIQGPVTIQSSLSVTGNGSFGGTLSAGSLNVQNLQISGDLQFTRHIDAGGGTPTAAGGPGLGGGGTASVSGTDTAGTVSINTGGSASGCFATVTFNQRFNGTPHVVVTPVGASAGALDWYITRTGTNFSVCTANAAPGGSSFAFDFIVID